MSKWERSVQSEMARMGEQGDFCPLFAASQGGHLGIVDRLIAAGCDVNHASEVSGVTFGSLG
eukprot:1721666-Rhodomonas_salina.2